ncbi:MAG: UDP-N-acetylmuramoyl-L-alanine--D-glutamate ligase [Candidatus Kerfeldbacteria bacterium]|nr:UDP-N-acetylmuramoyl-L-alanine--D-glutamate ligase [Candidatus Kerfeldbacteria bacterium]
MFSFSLLGEAPLRVIEAKEGEVVTSRLLWYNKGEFMRKNLFKNKRITLVGLGRYPKGSSFSSAEFLLRQGARVTVVDEKPASELPAFSMWKKRLPTLTYKLATYTKADILSADMILRAPNILGHHPLLKKARARKIPIHTDISLFFLAHPSVDVGITGTRGKSTTSALVAAILRKHWKSVYLGGNISVSPLTFVHKLRSSSHVILELSSYLTESLQAVHKSPHVACVTNVYRDHLNVHRNFQEYVHAKEEIFRSQQKNDFCVLNADDRECVRMARSVPSQVIWFSRSRKNTKQPAVFVEGLSIVFRDRRGNHAILPTSLIRLRGEHNIANVCAAVAIATALHIPNSAIRKGVASFRGLPHRLEVVANKKNFQCVNDSSSTIPDATIAALKSFDEPVILLFGGNDKKLDFRAAACVIHEHATYTYILPGTASSKIKRAFTSVRAPFTSTLSLADAFSRAVREHPAGTILLSPGASSFHEFENEFERGEAFRTLVNTL